MLEYQVRQLRETLDSSLSTLGRRVQLLHDSLCTTSSPGTNHCFRHNYEVDKPRGVVECVNCGLQFDVIPESARGGKCECWPCELQDAAKQLD